MEGRERGEKSTKKMRPGKGKTKGGTGGIKE